MIALHSVEVKNFKSLFDTKIEKFGTINMFYGFNNSGKSNVFKFLKLLFERKKKGTRVKVDINEEDAVRKTQNSVLVDVVDFWDGYIWEEPFLFTKNKRAEKILFKVVLNVDNSNFTEIEELSKTGFLNKDSTMVTLTGQISSVDIETSELRVTKALMNDKPFYEFVDEIEYFFDGVESDTLNEKSTRSILGMFNDLVLFIDSDRNFTQEISKNGVTDFGIKNFKNALYELDINAEKNDMFRNLVKFLSKFDFSEEAKEKLGNNLKSFPFSGESSLDFARFENEIEIMLRNSTGRFPLKNYGTGIQQFLFILTKMFHSKSRVLIIEELELNLSPLYQKELLRFLKQMIPDYFDQLIFSSHSPFFAQKDAAMIDIIHHVQIDFVAQGGTSVDCHDDIQSINDNDGGLYYFTLLYS